MSRTFILKIAGECNINCTYCYVYNRGDTTFRSRPRVMSKDVAVHSLRRILSYAERSGINRVQLNLHGGEPLLVGKEWMQWLLRHISDVTPTGLTIELAVQTNGTLLDAEWVELLSRHSVGIGVSLDGPAEWHDRHRVNFAGHGTHAQVRRAIDLLRASGTACRGWGVLVVANPACPGVNVYRHLLELGVRHMDFLWPDHHHDSPPAWPAGSLGRYYVDLFDAWYGAGDPAVEIRFFLSAMRMIVGGAPSFDSLGPQPLSEVVIETDGSLEPLDVLRTCENGFTQLGVNVLRHDVEDLQRTRLFRTCLENQSVLPDQCRACPVYNVCGGGYMPHRWGNGRGFGNPSIYCDDLLTVLTHVAERVGRDRRLAQAPEIAWAPETTSIAGSTTI